MKRSSEEVPCRLGRDLKRAGAVSSVLLQGLDLGPLPQPPSPQLYGLVSSVLKPQLATFFSHVTLGHFIHFFVFAIRGDAKSVTPSGQVL